MAGLDDAGQDFDSGGGSGFLCLCAKAAWVFATHCIGGRGAILSDCSKSHASGIDRDWPIRGIIRYF